MAKPFKNTVTRTQKLILCSIFTAFIAVGAFLQIPLPYYDYFTMQTFFVIMAGLLLGPYLGMASVLTYIVLGLAGLPIFAAGGGISYVLRPSFGFIIGFLLSAGLAGFFSKYLSKTGFGKKIVPNAIFAIISLVPTYVVGLVYKYFILKYYMGQPLPFAVIFASCFPIDIPVDILCCILAGFLASRLDSIKIK